MDELWLRQPQIINDEELCTYENLFPYFLSALEKMSSDTPIITEGACFLPFMVDRAQIDKAHYICVVPSKDFQIKHFKKRLPIWINDYLSFHQGGCADKEKAFDNWMEHIMVVGNWLRDKEATEGAGCARIWASYGGADWNPTI